MQFSFKPWSDNYIYWAHVMRWVLCYIQRLRQTDPQRTYNVARGANVKQALSTSVITILIQSFSVVNELLVSIYDIIT